ncbi:MAG TPA: hypothetical protein VG692_14780, partial [Gemmatimonadales bacterium]|nr:hypothetical protein [Gemmatimonadales bacterium]
GERAAALAGIGDLPAVGATVDSLIAAKDTAAPWVDIVALVGAKDAEAASALTDRLVAWAALTPSYRGRLLLQDAERLTRIDAARGLARVHAVESVAAGTDQVAEAQMFLARRRLLEVDHLDSLRVIAGEIAGMEEGAGAMMPMAQRLAQVARKVAATADSLTPEVPQGDLRLFLAGELARDSLGAPRLAALQFRRIMDEWPASPFAPKALLALLDLQPLDADSLQARMRATYTASPYLIATDGGDSPQLGELEDSLRRFVANYQAGRSNAPRGTPAQRRPSQPNRPSTPTTEPQF